MEKKTAWFILSFLILCMIGWVLYIIDCASKGNVFGLEAVVPISGIAIYLFTKKIISKLRNV